MADDKSALNADGMPYKRTRCLQRGCTGLLKHCTGPEDHLGRDIRDEWPHQIVECEKCKTHAHLTPAQLVITKKDFEEMEDGE